MYKTLSPKLTIDSFVEVFEDYIDVILEGREKVTFLTLFKVFNGCDGNVLLSSMKQEKINEEMSEMREIIKADYTEWKNKTQ